MTFFCSRISGFNQQDQIESLLRFQANDKKTFSLINLQLVK